MTAAAIAAFTMMGTGDAAPGQSQTLYVAPGGTDSSGCTSAAPCATLQRAYALSRPGGVVEMAGGSYPSQAIARVDRPAGTAVTLKPRAGQAVTIEELWIGYPEEGNGPRDLVVEGLTIGPKPVSVFEGSQRIVLRNLRAPNFYIRGAQNVLVDRGTYGPCTTDGVTAVCANSKIDGNDPKFSLASDITIQGVRFQDYRIVPGSGAHFECLFVRAGVRVSILRSVFERCEFFDIFVQYSGQPLTDLRVEGNLFHAPLQDVNVERDTAFELSGRGYLFERVTLRRNSFINSFPFLDDGTGAGLAGSVVEANIAKTLGCMPGVTYIRNATQRGEPCGATDFQASFGYTVGSGALVVEPKAAAAIRAAFEAAESGKSSLKTIARDLKRRRLPAPRGGWTVKNLDTLLRDKFVLGSVIGAPGTHPAIVPYKLWRRVQRELARTSARS
ncbi:MAG: recombinase family protein [Gaiella sp.]